MGGFPVYQHWSSSECDGYLCEDCHADAYTDDDEAEAWESASSGDPPSSDSEGDCAELEAGADEGGETVRDHVH